MKKPVPKIQIQLDWFDVANYIDSKHGKEFMDKSDIWNEMVDRGLTNDSRFSMMREFGNGERCEEAVKIIFEEFSEHVERSKNGEEDSPWDSLTFWVCW